MLYIHERKGGFIKKVVVLHTKGGEDGVICNCVKNVVVEEKEEYKSIGLCGFDYKFFEEEEGTWGVDRA